jgi:hypothetical protein
MTHDSFWEVAVKHFVRLAALLLLVSLVVVLSSTLSCKAEAGAGSHPAKASVARKACASRTVACVLFRAGRITVVQTTSALVRVMKHEFVDRRDTVTAAPSRAR